MFVFDYDGQSVRYNLNGTTTRLDTSYSQWYGTACAIDNKGHVYASAQNGDAGVGSNISGDDGNYANYKFYALADLVTGSHYNGVSGAYSQGGNSVALEWSKANKSFRPERIQNPKIAVSGSNSTKMYTTYYDSAYSRIVFRYGTASRSTENVSFSGGIVERDGNAESAEGVQIIASGDSIGEYSAVGVIPDGITGQTGGTAVVCWKDGDTHKFNYNETPSSSSGWKSSNIVEIDTDYAGEYCDLAVDAAGYCLLPCRKQT